MRFTQLPTLLVLSPRDRIERISAYPLEHGLTIEKQNEIEAQILLEVDVSALIVPLGGLAVYPAMMIESSNLPYAFEVAAHEWAHHYLAFYPLGFSYGATPALYTINETVASIIGKEIAWEVLSRFYPDLAPPPPDYTPQPSQPVRPEPEDQPVSFDFRTEMRETRIGAEELLSAGLIDDAEAYMEQQRLIFLQNGYRIRKINQAYFAFYGSYADEPGYAGADPIGPAVRELRYRSRTLADFLRAVRGVTSLEELEARLGQSRRSAQ
jgi:hypothetical protein